MPDPSSSDPFCSLPPAKMCDAREEHFAVGILAYGSLIGDPGPEIGPQIRLSLLNAETPFPVEYARSSRSRGGAPTLVPVETGGAQVAAVIHVLEHGVTVEQAMDWVWRREVGKYGKQHYRPNTKPGKDNVVVETLSNLRGVNAVLYARIGANIAPLTAEELAKRAIDSARSPAGEFGRDGISYLVNALRHGINTPLTAAYEAAILRITNSPDLVTALERARKVGVTPTADELKLIVMGFCQECVWTWCIRTHFAQLYESGERRHRLLAEIARTFFHDMNLALLEYVLLQQCKLTDPASSGVGKDNLTTNYIVGLPWTAETQKLLKKENDELMKFRNKINDARRRLVAHTDLRTRIDQVALGSFTKADELEFWAALQRFVNVAHEEAVGGPFGIEASTPDGDAATLIQRLVDAIDYDDLTKKGAGVPSDRTGKRRYDDV